MPISETGLRWPPSGGSGITEDDDSLTLKVESEGVLCGSGTASASHKISAPDVADYATAPLPDYDGRPDAAPEALVEGQIMGTFVQEMEASALAQYLLDVQEDLDLYAANKIVHPGWLLRLGNRALSMNVKLGPWIHVGSKITNFAVARYGDTLESRARVAKQYEHKGHRFVELEVLLVANGETAIAQIDHTLSIAHVRSRKRLRALSARGWTRSHPLPAGFRPPRIDQSYPPTSERHARTRIQSAKRSTPLMRRRQLVRCIVDVSSEQDIHRAEKYRESGHGSRERATSRFR